MNGTVIPKISYSLIHSYSDQIQCYSLEKAFTLKQVWICAAGGAVVKLGMWEKKIHAEPKWATKITQITLCLVWYRIGYMLDTLFAWHWAALVADFNQKVKSEMNKHQICKL